MKSFIIDCETLGRVPDGVLLDISVLVTDLDSQEVIKNPPSFFELVQQVKSWKLDVRNQLELGRKTDPSVIAWWKEQSETARQILIQTGKEVKLFDALDQIPQFLMQQGFDFKYGLGYCRGQSFDFPLLSDCLSMKFGVKNTNDYEFCKFYNQRDIRSIICGIMVDPKTHRVPLRKEILQGFIPHNSAHDIAKDALQIIYAKRYAYGIDEIPLEYEQ